MAAQTAPDLDPLALEHQVCFALSVTNRAVLAVYRPLLEPLGLTHPQYLVMLTLWDQQQSSEHPKIPVGQGDCGDPAAGFGHALAYAQTLGSAGPDHAHPKRHRRALHRHRAHRERHRPASARLKIPPAVIARLGVDITELQHLHEVLTRINSAALAAGALES